MFTVCNIFRVCQSNDTSYNCIAIIHTLVYQINSVPLIYRHHVLLKSGGYYKCELYFNINVMTVFTGNPYFNYEPSSSSFSPYKFVHTTPNLIKRQVSKHFRSVYMVLDMGWKKVWINSGKCQIQKHYTEWLKTEQKLWITFKISNWKMWIYNKIWTAFMEQPSL
jgi:hypothetical protein